MKILLFFGLSMIAAAEPKPLGSLEGHWLQSCMGYYQASETFEQDQVAFEEVNFDKPNCLNPRIKIQSIGSFALGSPAVSPLDAWTMDFVFKAVKIQILAPSIVDQFRARGVCGFHSWELGQWIEVTGLHCDLWQLGKETKVPSAGEFRFGIVKREQDRLFFGKLSPNQNALTPEGRPNEWNPAFFLRQE